MKRFSFLVLFALVLSGCGGGGAKGPVGTAGRYSFDLHWAINTRSFEQDARSLRVTATRVDGTGTPVTAIFNRPGNIDVVNTVTLPGDFRPGRHTLAFDLYDGLNGAGTRIGIGLLERRMSPDSDNRVRVNIGAPDALPDWRINGFSSTRGASGTEVGVKFSTGTSASAGSNDSESAVNLVPNVALQVRVGGSRFLEQTGATRFRLPETGFYLGEIIANGIVQSQETLRVTGPNPNYSNPVINSPWPTSWGAVGRTRAVTAAGPRSLGVTERVSLQDFARIEDGQIAVAEDGDLIVLYESTAGSEAAVARFSPDLSVRRWRTLLPPTLGSMLQVSILRNGLVLIERTGRFDAINAQSGALDWGRSVNRTMNWPAPILDNFVAGDGEFLSLGSGNRAFVTNNRVLGVGADGTAVNAVGDLFDLRNPASTVPLNFAWGLHDAQTGWVYGLPFGWRAAYNLDTGAEISPWLGTWAVALLPGQGEIIGINSSQLIVASATTLATVRSLSRGFGSVAPITFTNRMLLTSDNSRLRAINLDNGTELWNFGSSALALGGASGRAYALFDDGTLGMVAE